MSAIPHAPVLILGSGPAGYSAAVYAARADLRPMLIIGTAKGAASTADTGFGPWPTDVGVVQGPELKRRLFRHAERFSTRVVFDRIKSVNLTRLPLRVTGDHDTYSCDALIVAVDDPLTLQLFQGQLEMRDGHISTRTGLSGMATKTSVPGVFVAGDVKGAAYGQLITSTGTGCMAALDAQRFLGH
jgi:thioredoxin reductase